MRRTKKDDSTKINVLNPLAEDDANSDASGSGEEGEDQSRVDDGGLPQEAVRIGGDGVTSAPGPQSDYEQLPACLEGFSENTVMTVTAVFVATVILSIVLALVRANGDDLLSELPVGDRYTGRYAAEPFWSRNGTATSVASGR